MKERLKTLLVTGGLTHAEHLQMMDDNLEEDARSVRISCLAYSTYFSVLAIVWGMRFGISFVLHDVGLILCLLALFAFHRPKKGRDNIVGFELLVAFGIMYGLLTEYYLHAVGESSFALVGCMMIIILTCPFRPIMGTISVLIGVILYVLEIVITNPPGSMSSDLVNTISFGTAACFIQSEVNGIRVRAYLASKQNKIQAHMDSLTGLNNRMDFSLKIGEYSENGKELPTCIYVDVNGLHDLNNRLGHEAGDKMLKFVGGRLCTIFGKESTYRVGGDEFVILTAVTDEKYLVEKIEKLRADLAEENYSASVGYSLPSGREESIDKLIQTAETAMYADKSEYYRKNHIDRRTRHT